MTIFAFSSACVAVQSLLRHGYCVSCVQEGLGSLFFGGMSLAFEAVFVSGFAWPAYVCRVSCDETSVDFLFVRAREKMLRSDVVPF